MSFILGDCTKYLNQIWFTAQQTHNRQTERAKFTYHAILNLKMTIFWGYTTGNDCKMAFSLHVVESVSDDYNF